MFYWEETSFWWAGAFKYSNLIYKLCVCFQICTVFICTVILILYLFNITNTVKLWFSPTKFGVVFWVKFYASLCIRRCWIRVCILISEFQDHWKISKTVKNAPLNKIFVCNSQYMNYFEKLSYESFRSRHVLIIWFEKSFHFLTLWLFAVPYVFEVAESEYYTKIFAETVQN